MSCCAHCGAIDATFNRRVAEWDLRRYRRKGPHRSTRALVAAIREAGGVAGASVLHVGGGVGAVTHELLAAGAARATLVEASASYLAAAREEAERRQTAARVDLRQGDFVALAAELRPADVVTLDRVICCYPDMESLVASSARRARRLYGAVYPRDGWWMRLAVAAVNLAQRVRGSAFRVYVFPTAAIDAAVRRAGLAPRSRRRGLVWVVALYERPATSS